MCVEKPKEFDTPCISTDTPCTYRTIKIRYIGLVYNPSVEKPGLSAIYPAFHPSEHFDINRCRRSNGRRRSSLFLERSSFCWHIASRLISSHRIASHRIASHRIASHCIAWHCIASHRIASRRIASHRVASRRIASCLRIVRRIQSVTRDVNVNSPYRF